MKYSIDQKDEKGTTSFGRVKGEELIASLIYIKIHQLIKQFYVPCINNKFLLNNDFGKYYYS
jgi:hypothetical protein